MFENITTKVPVTILAFATAFGLAVATARAAEKWDMPMAYAASNYHSATGAEFAKCITTGTGVLSPRHLNHDAISSMLQCFTVFGEVWMINGEFNRSAAVTTLFIEVN